MSVIFYGAGDHGSGFIGFRVCKTINGEPEPRQKYFPLSSYGYVEAYSMAHKLDQEWQSEAKKSKDKRRKSTKKSMTETITDSLERLSDMALLANERGIRSTQQLSVFLRCAEQEGNCLYDIFGLATDSPEYKRLCATVRQLMLGQASRGNNGANLLTWGELIYGKERAVILTQYGHLTLQKIRDFAIN